MSSTFSEACAPGMTFRLMSAVERIPHFTASTLPSGSSYVLQWSKGWIKKSEAVVTALIRGTPLGVRLDRVEQADTGGDGLVNVSKDSGGNAAEERRSIRGALVGRRAPDRQAEDGGEDAKPELAASAAAGDVAGTRVDPELAQQLERVAQPIGDTLQHGADERAAVVSKREPGESGARVRVRVRRPLPGEVGEERQALGARRATPAPRPVSSS